MSDTIVATLLRAPAGVIELPGEPEHILTVHAAGRIGATFECRGRSTRRLLTPGDIDLIPAGEPVRLTDEGPNSVLALQLPTAWLDRQADDVGRDGGALRPLIGVRDPVLEALAWKLERRRGAQGLYDDCLADELGGRLLRLHDPRADEHPAARFGALAGARLRRVLEVIEAEIDGPLRIHRLAAEARLGTTAFKAGFKKAMGEPVHRYVVRRRAQRARLLLLERAGPASQIALEVGFSHQTHMARWLQRLFGICPSDLERLGGAP